MIANIYIEGQIGSSHNEDGSVDVKGVELQDVVAMVHKNQHAEKIVCHITSPGGSVDVGRKIAEYFNSISNLHTLAEVQCASIATEIHLSVPVERRQIATGTEYMIHEPMFSLQRGVSLNSDELALMATEIGKTQAEMVSMYTKATGMDKTALQLLMKQETALTPEQCKQFGFVSEIITSPMQAVALLTPTKNNDNMSTIKEEIAALRLQVAGMVAGQKVTGLKLGADKVSLDVTADDGTMLIIVTEADVPAVGDGVMLEDGSNAEDETYVTAMGTMVVVNGAITEYTPAEPAADDSEMEALKVELAALKAEKEENEVAIEALKVDVVAMAKLQSTYKPKAKAVAFKKVVEAPSKEESQKATKEAIKAKFKK
jgi:ATP-dependent protease ClpP protease subunit